MKTITINEHSEYLACKAIHQELQKYLRDGWTSSSAVCLEDQRYNVYDFEKNGEKIKVRFDLSEMRPLLGIQFTIMSMMLANPDCDFDKLKETALRMSDSGAIADQTIYQRYISPIVERVLGLAFFIFIVWIFVQCSN